MPASDTLTPRLLYREDMALTTTPNPSQVTVIVLGAGSVSVTPLDIVFYGSFTQAVNDAAAAIAGVLVGQVYFNLTYNNLATRMS